MAYSELRLDVIEQTLARPLVSSSGRWTQRRAIIIRLVDASGLAGFGEAAPLPGYSPDTLEECARELEALSPAALPEDRGSNLFNLLEGAARQLCSPAARHALQTALVDLWAKQRGVPAWQLLRGALQGEFLSPVSAPPESLAVSTLLDLSDDALLRRAEIGLSQGFRCFKIKVGLAGRFEAELSAARRLREQIGPESGLRLDANRAFDKSDRDRVLALAELTPEYVEEPFAGPALAELDRLPLPVALDESLVGSEATAWVKRVAARQSLGALVLKPTTLGGYSNAVELSKLAWSLGSQVVVSHCFEGQVGWASAAALGLALSRPGAPASALERHPGISFETASPSEPVTTGAWVRAWPTPGLGIPDRDA